MSVLPFASVIGSSIWSSIGYAFIELLFTSISPIVISVVSVFVYSNVIFQMLGSVSSFAISYSTLFSFNCNFPVLVICVVVVVDVVVIVVEVVDVVLVLVVWDVRVVVVEFVDVCRLNAIAMATMIIIAARIIVDIFAFRALLFVPIFGGT